MSDIGCLKKGDKKADLILASSSPRRIALLDQIGLAFKAVVPRTDERARPGETVKEHALRVARAKAEKVAQLHPEALVLGAETKVLIGGEALGKPRDRHDAMRMLKLLSGKAHHVMTAVVLLRLRPEGYMENIVTTKVKFKKLGAKEIEAYLLTEEHKDKAGAYAIQGKGALFVESIEGCYSNVVGLPLFTVGRMLSSLGFDLWG